MLVTRLIYVKTSADTSTNQIDHLVPFNLLVTLVGSFHGTPTLSMTHVLFAVKLFMLHQKIYDQVHLNPKLVNNTKGHLEL
jgi:hypothetical protein